MGSDLLCLVRCEERVAENRPLAMVEFGILGNDLLEVLDDRGRLVDDASQVVESGEDEVQVRREQRRRVESESAVVQGAFVHFPMRSRSPCLSPRVRQAELSVGDPAEHGVAPLKQGDMPDQNLDQSAPGGNRVEVSKEPGHADYAEHGMEGRVGVVPGCDLTDGSLAVLLVEMLAFLIEGDDSRPFSA